MREEEDFLGDGEVSGEEEDGEDLYDDNELMRDYRPEPELDHYDIRELDQSEYSEIDVDDRHAAEKEMRRRDKDELRRAGRIPRALDQGSSDESSDGERISARDKKKKLRALEAAGEDELADTNLEEIGNPNLKEVISGEDVQKEVRRRFKTFLTTFVDRRGQLVYHERIQQMCSANKQSLEVSFQHLSNSQPMLAIWVADMPAQMLEHFNEVASHVVSMEFEEYKRIHADINVRITDLPISDKLRDIRQVHLNALIKVSGVVTRRTGIFPQLKYVKYDCIKCGAVLGPFYQSHWEEAKLGSCAMCQSKGPFSVNAELTIYRNYQKITLQESPGSVPAGRLPRSKDVVLLGDMIDSARPGELIEVTGIYMNNFDSSLNKRNGFPVFSTVIEANYISKRDDQFSAFRLTEEDEKEIRQLSKDPRIGERIINSIAPSIFGHTDCKTAIALSMFGGQMKDIEGKHRIRGDINVLMVGDPGTAKSQFLKYVEKTAHRVVFTTGKGASAVGLTASVHKDPITREWVLEGGALVLADTGICLIDEFDKMSDQDRTSIHEAMEQQSISVSKAGIVTTLQARCAIMAAANPIGGRYDSSKPFNQNVELTEPILSRFDVLCTVKDHVDPIADEQLASFVVQSHARSHPDHAGDIKAEDINPDHIAQPLLRKYIVYARHKCKPKLGNLNTAKISRLYADLRKESIVGGMPIAVRHMESIIRMSEAHARMHLREHVTEEDADKAISTMLHAFIGTQKNSVQKLLMKNYRKYLTHGQDNNDILYYTLQQAMREEQLLQARISRAAASVADEPDIGVNVETFEEKCRALGISNPAHFYKSETFKAAGFKIVQDEQGNRMIVRAGGQ